MRERPWLLPRSCPSRNRSSTTTSRPPPAGAAAGPAPSPPPPTTTPPARRTGASYGAGRRRRPSPLGKVGEPLSRGRDQGGHVSLRVCVLRHELVRRGDLVERERPRQARVDPSVYHQTVEGRGLLVVGEVGPLEPLLPHPEVPEVGDGMVAGRPRTDHHHPAAVAHEDRCGHGVFPGVLEHDPGGPFLPQRLEEGLAEGAGSVEPCPVGGVLPVRRNPPVVEP